MQAESKDPKAEGPGAAGSTDAGATVVEKPDRIAFNKALDALNGELEALEEKRARVLSRLESARKGSEDVNVRRRRVQRAGETPKQAAYADPDVVGRVCTFAHSSPRLTPHLRLILPFSSPQTRVQDARTKVQAAK